MKEQVSVQELIDVLSGLIFHTADNCADATAFRNDAANVIYRLKNFGVERTSKNA